MVSRSQIQGGGLLKRYRRCCGFGRSCFSQAAASPNGSGSPGRRHPGGLAFDSVPKPQFGIAGWLQWVHITLKAHSTGRHALDDLPLSPPKNTGIASLELPLLNPKRTNGVWEFTCRMSYADVPRRIFPTYGGCLSKLGPTTKRGMSPAEL